MTSVYDDFVTTARTRDITQSFSTANPWAPAAPPTTAKLVELARRSGYQVCTDETVARCQELRDGSSSANYFRVLREIADLDRRLAAVNLELQECAADKDTSDLTSVTLLEKRVNSLLQLSGHLSEIIQQKEAVVQRLKHPHSTDCLRVDPSYQRHVVDTFKQASLLLADLNQNLDAIDWGQRHLPEVATNVEKELWKLTAAFDQLKAVMSSSADFRSVVGRRLRECVGASSSSAAL